MDVEVEESSSRVALHEPSRNVSHNLHRCCHCSSAQKPFGSEAWRLPTRTMQAAAINAMQPCGTREHEKKASSVRTLSCDQTVSLLCLPCRFSHRSQIPGFCLGEGYFFGFCFASRDHPPGCWAALPGPARALGWDDDEGSSSKADGLPCFFSFLGHPISHDLVFCSRSSNDNCF
jgi:hypothetical protein